MLRRVGPFLAWRRLPFLLAAAAMAISLPALSTGLLTDDYMHRAMLTTDSESAASLSRVGLAFDGAGRLGRALSDLFVVVDPDKDFDRFRAFGLLPWWTYEGYRVAHWRPVASLTHWLDYRLFPESIWLMHLHSILWFAAVVFLVTILYRRLISVGWMAGLAGVFYLISDDAYFPTMWLANRNLLISLFFGILTLIAHDRWRRDRWRFGRAVAPVCLLLSVLAAEGGIATFAYLFAYEVVLGSGRWRRRVLALLPSVLVIASWRWLYDLQGYGAGGGGFYLDPVRQPVAYVAAVFERLPFLLAGQWTTSPPELHSLLSSDARMLLWCVLAVIVVLIPLGLRPLLRENRRLWFWLIGMHAAALPVCATIPMSRSLLFVAIGAFGLIAECLGTWLEGARRGLRGRSGRLLGVLVVTLLIVHLPLATVTRAAAFKVTAKVTDRLNRTMAIGLYLRFHPDQYLVMVNAPNPASLAHDPFWGVCEGKSLPAGLRALAPGYGPMEVVRTGPRRLVLRSLSDSLLDCRQGWRIDPVFFFHRLSDVRGAERPMKVGERIALPRMTVDVLAVDERGSPSEVAFEFEVALEDRTLQWLYWDWDHRHFVVFHPPPVGQAVCLRGPF